MKKIKLYLESSALWNLYYEETGAELVEHCLENPRLSCISSIWSQLEIERGIKKRENQKEITTEEAEHLSVFIETDSKRLERKKQLEIIPIVEEYILTAKRFIHEYNLFASDALHLVSAIRQGCEGFLVDDYHFKRLNKMIETREGIGIYPTIMSSSDLKAGLNI
jgi:predicted nucleic acid-binding protein